ETHKTPPAMRPSKTRSAPTPKGTSAETSAKKAAARLAPPPARKASFMSRCRSAANPFIGPASRHEPLAACQPPSSGAPKEKALRINPKRLMGGDDCDSPVIAVLTDELGRKAPPRGIERGQGLVQQP